jgi:hypothetical protein
MKSFPKAFRGRPQTQRRIRMKLSEKQLTKVTAIVNEIDLGSAQTALELAASVFDKGSLKDLRKALVKELRKIDKALLVYGLDLALDEAKALIEKKG